MTYQLTSKPEWGMLATFVPNKQLPVYNWFYFKEGFSRELVLMLLDMFFGKDVLANAEDDKNNVVPTVLDPFCGSGTTLVACKEKGLECIGFEVLSSAFLASRVKTETYDIEKLVDISKRLFFHKFFPQERKDAPTIVRRNFNKYALEDILFFKQHILKIEDGAIRNFLMLALINAAMKVGWAWKDGAVIKTKKRDTRAPLRKVLKNVVRMMIKHAIMFQDKHPGGKIILSQTDARRMPLNDGVIDAVITSPPYLNNIDYTKVYAIENWIASGETEPAVRSFIKDEPELYFNDMREVLKELKRVCKPGAPVALVVGNAYLQNSGTAIETDTEIARIAEELGFTVENIFVLNQRAALVDRTTKVGSLRESLILMRT